MLRIAGSIVVLIIVVVLLSRKKYTEDVTLLSDGFILTSNGTEVLLQISMATGKTRPLKFRVNKIVTSITYDYLKDVVYFSDQTAEFYFLKKAKLNGDKAVELIKSRRSDPGIITRVCIDPTEELIFYGGKTRSYIQLLTYSGHSTRTVVRNYHTYGFFDIDTVAKKIYFANLADGKIKSCNYDGSQLAVVFTTSSSDFLFSVSWSGSRLYASIARSLFNEIISIDTNGKDYQVAFKYTDTPYYHKNTLAYDILNYEINGNDLYVVGSRSDTKLSTIIKVTEEGDKRYTLVATLSEYCKDMVIVDIAHRKSEFESRCTGGSADCSDLCIPLALSYVCSCNATYRLLDDLRTCSKVVSKEGPDVMTISNNAGSGYIKGIVGDPRMYAHEQEKGDSSYWQLEFKGRKWTAFDVDYERSQIYAFDENEQSISIINLNGSSNLQILNIGASTEVYGLAYDWVNSNLYWTDAQLNWIRMTDREGLFARTVVEQQLETPHGIAVHPALGKLYWTDRGERSKVMSSNLDGSNITLISDYGVHEPRGIAVDFTHELLYWANEYEIGVYDILRGVVLPPIDYAKNHVYQDVALLQNYLISTGEINDDKAKVVYGRFMYDLDDKVRSVSMQESFDPLSVKVFDKSTQLNSISICGHHTCPHLCTAIPAANSTDLIAKCMCTEGYVLNGTVCKEVTSSPSMLIFVTDTAYCEVSLSSAVNNLSTGLQCHPNGMYSTTISLAFNWAENCVYYSEFKNRGFIFSSIMKHTLSFYDYSTIQYINLLRVGDIVYDWISGNIYWSFPSNGEIWVVTERQRYSNIFVRSRPNLLCLQVDLKNQRLLWTESSGQTSSIMQSTLDGRDIQIYYQQTTTATNVSITSLDVDYLKDRLYWIDPQTKSIVFASLSDSSTRKTIKLNKDHKVFSMAVIKDYIAYVNVDSNNGSFNIIDVDTAEITQHINLGGVYHASVIAVSQSNQPRLFDDHADYPCSRDNGGCSQFCFGVTGGRRCSCPYGQRLSIADQRSCEPSSPLTGAVLMMSSFVNRQLYYATYDPSAAVIDIDLEHMSSFVLSGYQLPKPFDYDSANRIVFWASSDDSYSYYMNIDDKEVIERQVYQVYNSRGHKVNNRSTGKISDMVYESSANLLYTAIKSDNAIDVSNKEGTYYRRLANIDRATGIEMDPANGYMYVLSIGNAVGHIYRLDMDGNNKTLLVTQKGMDDFFTIDLKFGQMYWSANMSRVIMTSDLKGAGVRPLFNTMKPSHESHIAASHGHVVVKLLTLNYFIVWNGHSVDHIPARDGITIDFMRFVDTDQIVKTACSNNNGNCTHFCIPLPDNKRTCVCPHLSSNNGTVDCKSSEMCSTAAFQHGQFDITCNARDGTTCTVTCDLNYSMSHAYLQCRRGKWSYDPSTICIRRTCPVLKAPLNAYVNLECPVVPKAGTLCSVHCDSRSKFISGSHERKCDVNGHWIGKHLVCKREDCKNDFLNGYFVSLVNKQKRTAKGQSAHYRCYTGYVSVDDNVYVCAGDGVWNVDTGTLCTRIMCHGSEKVAGAIDTCTYSNEVGSSCHYRCQTGYHYDGGSLHRYCQMNSTWDNAAIRCAEDDGNTRTKHIGKIIGITIAMFGVCVIIAAIGVFVWRDDGLSGKLRSRSTSCMTWIRAKTSHLMVSGGAHDVDPAVIEVPQGTRLVDDHPNATAYQTMISDTSECDV